MQDFKDQIAFITGGASGAGLGQAEVFGKAGATIVIADVRPEAVRAALGKLADVGINAHGIVLDITDRAAYAKAADEVEAVFGSPPTMVFHTAGVNSFGPLENTTYGDFDWLIGVNLGGVINGMVTFVPRMIAAGKPGHIVAVSSMGGFEGSNFAGPYSVAKAGVISLMEGYRKALAKHDIGVTVLCPANIKTNIAEATKLRPAAFGESGYVANEATIASLQSIHAHGMDPIDLANHLKAAIEANDLYCIPYPEEKENLARYFAGIVDAVLPLEADPEGARQRAEALEAWRNNQAAFRKDAEA